MRTRDDWQKALDAIGLGVFAPLFLMHMQPCLAIQLRYIGNDETLDTTPIGSSKVGGRPDVPVGFAWPTIQYDEADKVAIPFLAQIRLEDIVGLNEENALPHSGLLSFFFDFSHENDAWRVFHFSEVPNSFERLSFPEDLPEYGTESPHKISFTPRDSLPSIGSPEIYEPFERIATENDIVDTNERYRLMDAYQQHLFSGEDFNLLLGHDSSGEGSRAAANWWQENYDEPIGQSDRDWRLLFQLDEGSCSGLNLGSGSGGIAFLIRNVDLENENFDDVYAAYLK